MSTLAQSGQRRSHAQSSSTSVGRRRYILSRLAATWEYVLAALVVFLVRFPTLNNQIMFIDEPTYLVRALGITSIERFFYYFHYEVGLFPFSLLPYIVASRVSYVNAILGVRILGLVAVIVSLCLLVRISKVAFSSATPSVFAGGMWLLYLYKNDATVPPLLEYFQTPYLLGAFLVFLLYLKSEQKSTWQLFWAGLLVGLGALSKPPGLFVVGLFLLALLIAARVGKAVVWGQLLKRGIALCVGVLLPVLAFTLPYLLKPETLPDIAFNIFGIMSSYMGVGGSLAEKGMDLVGQMEAVNALPLLAAFTWFVGERLVHRGRDWAWPDTCQMMLLGMGSVMFVAYWGGHAKPHYLIASLPFFLLFVGYRFTLLRELLPTRRLRLAFLALFCIWVTVASVEHVRFYLWAFYDRGNLYATELPGVDTPSLVRYIQANSNPTDKIWVYYNAPEIYWMANRAAATQEPTGTWLAEHYNSLWIGRTYNELLADKPALLVGFDKVRYDEGNNTPKLQELARIGDMVAKDYTCSDSAVQGTTICKRRTR